jgi:nucleotidyltransferase/DNA polymerase involved in DNA repair
LTVDGGIPSVRWVLYVDMDAFYVECERRARPELAGKPVIVGPDPKLGPTRGVVLSASYEARPSGVRSAMPARVAARLCPEAVWVAADFSKYETAASEVRDRLARFSTQLTPLSIDEAALVVDRPGLPEAEELARDIQKDLHESLRLPATIGGGPNRLVAKIATDQAKPGGVRVVAPSYVVEFLSPLPVRSIPGVGPKTEERLRSIGVEQVGHLSTVPRTTLVRVMGSFGTELRRLARGEYEDPPESAYSARSRSVEQTFAQDLDTFEAVERSFEELATQLARALESERVRFQTVSIAVRWEDFTRVQRSRTLPAAGEGGAELLTTGRRLLRELWAEERAGRARPARMLSVGVERLAATHTRARPLETFDQPRIIK